MKGSKIKATKIERKRKGGERGRKRRRRQTREK
jgi:hypothetical protein